MHFPVSLRWTSYVFFVSPQRGLKNAKRPFFHLKLHFTLRKSATKFLFGNTVSDLVVRHSLAYLSVQKWFAGFVPYYVKICLKLPNPLKNADFRSIFACSASVVTPGEKSSMCRKSTMRFKISLIWTVYVVSKPQRRLKNAKCLKFDQ